ncbi:CheR family methyltransferase [Roseiconus lacunae]|uniref:histidine kinase n=1 Tax=Roseiconus lacunae TaxID=2605694 RepID=A0ABT7PLF5_9BACT|nr:CheR family methyltransferase [Roseiconus lacunae]MCD0460939.1 PAS domain-containing protein [Roseiconus lacunae]MDM4017305.1 CheR family methyltransferase [Roseiconus lacunae]
MPDSGECYIVGIGASAGGLQALEEFFLAADPEAPLAYVVIQHLSPDFKSVMDQLLSRKTKLPVHVIEDGMQVEPRNVYLMPARKEAIVSDGKLRLTDRTEHEQLSFPIDYFLRSLAQDAGPRAIAVILSGTGSDGSRGIREISECGGLVVAQSDPSFDGMPHSAIATEVVDLELPARKIGASLVRHLTSSGEDLSALVDDESSGDESVAAVFDHLNLKFGINFANYRTEMMLRRLNRRRTLSGHADLAAYAKWASESPDELEKLYHDLLIGVTQFFRDPEVFEYFESSVIPRIVSRLEGQHELRAWVAGCGTGEEAYSIAIAIAEHLERHGLDREVRIFASDVHEQSLSAASQGIYSEGQLTGISDDRLQRYFIRRNGNYQVAPSLRKMVVFSPHNILRDAPFTKLDLVTCRNLLIYLTPSAQRKVLGLFHFGLKRDGFLCLGASETIGDLQDVFKVVDAHTCFYAKCRDRFPAKAFDLTGTLSTERRRLVGPEDTSGFLNTRSMLKTYDRLLEEFIPPSILINSEREILHTFSKAGRYLQFSAGRPTKDVLTLLHPDLSAVASRALRQAEKTGKKIVVPKVECQTENGQSSISLSVLPVRSDDASRQWLIQFDDPSDATSRLIPSEELQSSSESLEINDLRRELDFTKESLQATIEELQTTNEELQSANEELVSSNEELQSTNEELHSVNEELYTVNSEHQRKITELTELTNDINNLLNGSDVHQLFLDRELGIRRFTSGAAAIFNLIPQDIGRRFDNFSHRIKHDTLDNDIEAVIETGVLKEFEVRDDVHDTWYLMRIRPYVAPNGIDGIVLTLVDITSLKVAQARLMELSEIVEHTDDAIYRVNLDGEIRTWNRGAARLFGYESKEIVGRRDSLLTPDDRSAEASDYYQRIRDGLSVDRLETIRSKKNGDRFDVSLTVSPIQNHNGDIEGASIIARDITQQRRAESEIRRAVQQRDQFLATLSHELRNPFAAILNAYALSKESELDHDAERESREVMEAQLQHVSLLLDDLLDVARFTNGKLTIRKRPIDITKLTNPVLDCVQHRFDRCNQSLQIQVDDEPIYVLADAGRLQQAQVNLLVNASKYSPSRRSIWYSVGRDGDQAVVTVRDEGEGISATLLPTIFEPFTQSEQDMDRTQGGMGLGLSIVKAIVDAHGGTIDAHSPGPNRGSEFVLRLPLTSERPQVTLESPESLIAGIRVLLVEDNDGIRRMLARSLQLRGFQVITAANGRSGLREVDREDPDVAVVDIGLPDVDGYEFAKVIRSDRNHRNLVMIAVTGYGRDEDRIQAEEAGFDLHLVKPVDPQRLIEAISKCCKLREGAGE